MAIKVYRSQVGIQQLPGFRERGSAVDAQAQQNVSRGMAQIGGAVRDAGQQVASAVDTIGKTVQAEHDRAEEAVYNDAVGNYLKRKQFLLEDPNGGYINRKGEAAMRERGQFDQAFNDLENELKATLKTPRSQEAFERFLVEDRPRRESVLDRHEAGQAEARATQSLELVTEALAAEAQSLALEGTPESLNAAAVRINQGAAALESYFKGRETPKEIAIRTKRYTSAAYIKAGEAMRNNGMAEAASGYLNALVSTGAIDKGMLADSGLKLKIDKDLLDIKAQRVVDGLMGDMFDLDTGETVKGFSAEDALVEIQGMDIPLEVKDKAIDRIVNIQNKARNMEQLADAPRIAEVEMGISAGRMRDANGNPTGERVQSIHDIIKLDQYQAASQTGRQRMENAWWEHVQSLEREARAKTAFGANLRAQERWEADKALAEFNARPFYEHPGEDQNTVNVDVEFGNYPKYARDKVKGAQKRVNKYANTIHQEPWVVLQRRINQVLEANPKLKATEFQSYFSDEFDKEAAKPENAGVKGFGAAWFQETYKRGVELGIYPAVEIGSFTWEREAPRYLKGKEPKWKPVKPPTSTKEEAQLGGPPVPPQVAEFPPEKRKLNPATGKWAVQDPNGKWRYVN